MQAMYDQGQYQAGLAGIRSRISSISNLLLNILSPSCIPPGRQMLAACCCPRPHLYSRSADCSQGPAHHPQRRLHTMEDEAFIILLGLKVPAKPRSLTSSSKSPAHHETVPFTASIEAGHALLMANLAERPVLSIWQDQSAAGQDEQLQ